MRAALGAGFVTATEVADFLAAKGVPFRQAHEVTGRLVAEAIARKSTLEELPIEVIRTFHPSLDESVRTVLDPEIALERRTGFGGPSSTEVRRAIAVAKSLLECK